MAIYDCFTFYDELDILEIRLTELAPFVDYFVLAEATETFSGRPKQLHFKQNGQRFAPFLHKIIHVVVDDLPKAEDAWTREAFQRDALARGLVNADANDLIMLSDVDEIPFPAHVARLAANPRAWANHILFIECDYYQFRLNLAVANKWIGLCAVRVVAHRHLLGMQALRALRARQSRRLPRAVNWGLTLSRNLVRFGALLRHVIIEHGGWHFTSVGSAERVVAKLASYAHEERNTPEFNTIGNMEDHHRRRTSLCGRRLVPVRLERLPRCIQADPERWSHLLEEA